MNFITLGKKWADGGWVLLKGPPHGLQAQRAYLEGIGVSDPTYSEARIIELGIGIKRIFYTPDEIITITASDKTITYGSNKPSSFAVTWSKNIPDTYYTGTLSTACAYTKGNNAGTYPITPSGLTATDKYAIAFVAGTLTVSKVALTLTVTDAEMVYGASAPSFAFTGEGYIAGEDATALGGSAVYTVKDSLGETVADLSTAAPGEYEVHLSGVTAANYELTMVVGTLTVSKKALTLTVANAEMVEGGAAPEFSFTGTGFVNDEDATALGGSAVYTVKDSQGETVADVTLAEPGTYSVHLSGITSENYEITLVAGTLTIAESGS